VQAKDKIRDQLSEGVFGADELVNIRAAIQRKYRDVSRSASGLFKYTTGRAGALELGYEPEPFADIPEELLESFCGVGNPFVLTDIAPGSTVLDIGCGAGLDLIVARRLAGEKGRVCGVDMSSEMIQRAEKNITEAGITDIEIKQVSSEVLPYDDSLFDVIISNGVINLSPCKVTLFKEMYRVLKPGGRLQFADIVLEKELPPGMADNLDAWAQ
jgi:2-polyprenyl-3-methyl-5-hydroxy-6-metoxy-1,4-benzoquinol methylase